MLLPEVDERAGRLHDEARDEVARDRGQGIGLEEEHEHRRHQRAAAHPGQPDDDADEQPAEGEREVDRHSAGGGHGQRDGEHGAMIPSGPRPDALR